MRTIFSDSRLRLAVLSGALYVLAYPPLPLGFVAAVALVPLLTAAMGARPRTALLLFSAFGLIAHVGLLWWVVKATPLIFLGIIYLALRWGIIGLLFGFIQRKSIPLALAAFPFLWVAFEYLSTLGEMAFPWTTIGTTQYAYLPVIQIASVAGVWGVSLWLVVVNVLFAVVWCSCEGRVRWRAAVAVAVVVPAPIVYGAIVLAHPSAPGAGTIDVACLQGNVDPYEKWADGGLELSFARYDSLASAIAAGPKGVPDLVVWPETALPAYVLESRNYTARLRAIVRRCPTWHLASSPEYERESRGYVYFNSAYLIDPDGDFVDRYDKILLLPFSERIPFSGSVKFLDEINLGEADFSPGTRRTVFDTPGGSFGVLICIESMFPDLARKYVLAGVDFLVVATNDGWFGRTPGPYQHAAGSVLRAVETRTPVVRCANTGVSFFVDAYGRRSDVTRLFSTEVIRRDVMLRGDSFSIYALLGDFVAWGSVVISALALVVAVPWRR